MAFDRTLWRVKFQPKSPPLYPCPRCDHGRLQLDQPSYRSEEPPFSASTHGHTDFDFDWIVKRFTFLMKCNIKECGEVVSFSGVASIEMTVDDDGDWVEAEILRPWAVFPAPPIIQIAGETPQEVTSLIKEAFALYWVNFAACAGALRASVEAIMNDLKIPTKGMKKGKVRRLDLFDRIEVFKNADPDQAPTLDALRIVGNVGVHEGKLNRATLLDAFHIYEDALAEIYGKRRQTVDAIRRKIIAAKGK